MLLGALPLAIRTDKTKREASMASRSSERDISDDEMERILEFIDEDTGMSVEELAAHTEFSSRHVQRILEALMERGQITSTPDWEYRQSRRSEA